MKKLHIIIGFFIFFISCKTETKNNINLIPTNKPEISKDSKNQIIDEKINLPIGFKKLIDLNFPKTWKNLDSIEDDYENFIPDKISNKGYDSISFFIERYYNSFYNNLKIDKSKKLKIIPEISKIIDNDKTNYFKIDSAYYSKTLLKKNNYTVEIYKDGGKYDRFKGYENLAVVNYETIVCFDLKRNIIDYKTIYYYEHALFAFTNNFFYIDKNLNITLKEFDVDEIETKNLGTKYFKIDKTGKFEETSIKLLIKKESKENEEIKIDTKYRGKFSIYVETEETISGIASITYNFNITSDTVILETNSYQEPILCNGRYKAIENENILEIYYDSDKKDCKSKKPIFYMKKEKFKYYIKGVGGEGTIKDWLELKKK